jgi:hypothetical protein
VIDQARRRRRGTYAFVDDDRNLEDSFALHERLDAVADLNVC